MKIVAMLRIVLGAALLFHVCSPAFAQDERRLALVIGVDDYEFAPLRNPVRDAGLVADALERIDFSVTRLPNPTKGEIRQAVDALYRQAREGSKNATIFVYFAGHGVQVGQDNYLIPSKAALEGRDLTYADFDDQAIHAQWMLKKLSETGVTRLIFALDACRDSPLAQSNDIVGGSGLAKMSAVNGGPDTLILFATQPGNTATDGGYANSPFSEALASTLAVPGQSTQDMISVVSEKVEGQTKGKQKPYFEGSLRHTFVRRDIAINPAAGAGGLAGALLVEQSRLEGPVSGALLAAERLKTLSLADIEQQSAQGNHFASFVAGMAYWEGLGGADKDIKKAARFMQWAVSQGSARAANAMGLFYCCSDEFPQDTEAAIVWFEIAAKGGSVFAMRNLGLELTKGNVPIDFEAGMNWLKSAAQNGNEIALANMATIHARTGSPVYDPEKALTLYRQAFSSGYPDAALNLGFAYRWGTPVAGGRVDLDKAMRYLIDGARAGCSTCWKEAGSILNDPKNAKRYDPEGALALFKSGSDAGDLEARIAYGNILREGVGSNAPDPIGALQAYRWAAAAGSLDGRRAVVTMLSEAKEDAPDLASLAPELRFLLENDLDEVPSKRHAIYDPHYWGIARKLIFGLRSGEITEAYPGEEADLTKWYGDGAPKRFTVPVTCGETKQPFSVYIVNWDRPNDETIEGQASWLRETRGCEIEGDVLTSFREVKKIARENNVDFTELATYSLYALYATQSGAKKKKANYSELDLNFAELPGVALNTLNTAEN